MIELLQQLMMMMILRMKSVSHASSITPIQVVIY